MSGTPALRTNPDGFRRDVRPPRTPPIPGTCDCHMHVVGPYAAYPLRETRSFTPPESTLDDYRATALTVGIDRMVVVQPSFFGTDNACTLDSVARMEGRARAVVVVDPGIADDALQAMHDRGARGVRLQMVAAGGLSLDNIERVADRIRLLGWHVQLYLDARRLPDLAGRLRRLPVDVVFDHMAHVEPDSGVDEEGFRILLDLLAGGRAWVKLSNALFPACADRARRLIAANPERALWGSDWPHVAYGGAPPDDGALLDALADWAGDEATRRRVLVDNPTALYFRT